MTPVQQMRQRAWATVLQPNLSRQFRTGDGQVFLAIVGDAPPLMDPETSARAETPVYVTITCQSGAIVNPRKAGKYITEVATGQSYEVLRFNETAGDQITWQWTCEATRKLYTEVASA